MMVIQHGTANLGDVSQFDFAIQEQFYARFVGCIQDRAAGASFGCHFVA
jgi:hypothetical protein